MSRQDRIREKRRLARLKKSQENQNDDDAELDDDEDIVVEEPIKKDYGEPMMPSMPPATSFAELDKYKEMQERSEKVLETSYELRVIIDNILYYSDLRPNEKADAIQKVGAEFGARVQNVISEDVSQMDKSVEDMDLLMAKSMLATDSRHVSVAEKFTDWMSKKKLTAAAEKKLSDDDFALVYDESGNKVRKYPIHDKAHVRNALARAAQMIQKGGKAAEDAKKALPKIRAAAKKMGIGMEKSYTSVIIEKDLNNDWRAVLLPSNNFMDRDGEIISDSAHREYVEWANKNMDCAPVFMTWHVPGTSRNSPIDYIGYENGFLVLSAPLLEKEAEALLKMQEQVDVGLSIGGIVLERDRVNKNIVEKYRMVEVSDLPLQKAANPFTDVSVIMKEAKMDVKQYLTNILGDEKAKNYLEKIAMTKEALQAADIPEKQAAEEKPVEQEVTETAEALTMEKVIKQVQAELGLEELSTQFAELQEKAAKVDVLEALVKDLAAKKEDDLAAMIQPRAAASFSWMNARASTSEKTVLKKDDEADKELEKAKPQGGWLSEVTKTAPIQ